MLVVKLDVTNPADGQAAVEAAVNRFGRIDVLVNNAANFYAGYFEELTPEQIEQQLATGLIGPMNVTRAVLPVMRKQRSGHIISISSGAGLMGFEFNSAYCAAKFGLEGWMEALQPEVAPFGINTTIVNPGFFRTELLTQESTAYAEPSIADYAERHAARREWYETQNGQQSGNPAKLAQALVKIASQQPPPRRFIAGADAIDRGRAESAGPATADQCLSRPVDLDGTGGDVAVYGCRVTGAENRYGLFIAECFGQKHGGVGVSEHVFCVAASDLHAGADDLLAEDWLAAGAPLAAGGTYAEPRERRRGRRPRALCHTPADCDNLADRFMAKYTRKIAR